MIVDLTKTSVEHRLDAIDRAREGFEFIIDQMSTSSLAQRLHDIVWDMYVRESFPHLSVPKKHEIVLYDERNAR